jgi:predicted amidohydrolase
MRTLQVPSAALTDYLARSSETTGMDSEYTIMNSKLENVVVRVGAAQMISEDNAIEANVVKALDYCDRAAKRGVQILCLPECAANGFDWLRKGNACQVRAEPVPGPMVKKFAAKATERDMYIIMGLVEQPKRSEKLFNTVFVVGPTEGYMGKFRKVLSEAIFEDGKAAPVFETRYGKIGIFICADMRSPDLSRLLVLKGARILFQPTNYFHPDGRDIKRRYLGKCTAQRARAMDNGVHLVVANAGRPEYVNNSRIIVPNCQGPEETLAKATRKEQLLVGDIEFNPASNGVRSAIQRDPWLFSELAEEIWKVTGAP